jgi:hypothetical protein
MALPVKLVAPLVVVGAALVVAGARPTGPGPTTSPVAQVATYQPPAFTPEVGLHARPAALSHHAGARKPAHRTARHRTAPKPATVNTVTPVVHHTVQPAVHRIVRSVTHHVRHATASVSGPTGWSALNAAIAKIPTYRPGAARWLVSTKYSQWGTADWYDDVLYVSPNVPTSYLYDVAVHEWSHELSVLDYAGDVNAATNAMNAWFGGSGLVGAERAADCMAILQGATWTHYTTCQNATWRAGAAKLVGGHRL